MFRRACKGVVHHKWVWLLKTKLLPYQKASLRMPKRLSVIFRRRILQVDASERGLILSPLYLYILLCSAVPYNATKTISKAAKGRGRSQSPAEAVRTLSTTSRETWTFGISKSSIVHCYLRDGSMRYSRRLQAQHLHSSPHTFRPKSRDSS